MTPQLQQAIRLLQLSALDLTQEVQEALEANPLLEAEEDYQQHANASEQRLKDLDDARQDTVTNNDLNNEREIQTDSASLSEELPVDSEWADVYDSYVPSTGAPGDGGDTEFLLQRGASPNPCMTT